MTQTEWNEALRELNEKGLYLFDKDGNQRTGHERNCHVFYAGYDQQDAINLKNGKGYGGSITFSSGNRICYLEAIHDHFYIEYD